MGRRKSEWKVNLGIRNSSRSHKWQLANDAEKRTLEPRGKGIGSVYTECALRIDQYLHLYLFCLWTKVHHIIWKSLVMILPLALKLLRLTC